MPTAKKPAKAKSPARPQFGDWDQPRVTALLVLADGTVIEGQGIGAEGEAVGEVCFNTAMTGYQEVLTDPSYAGQIVTFRMSAMSAPMTRTSRPPISRRMPASSVA